MSIMFSEMNYNGILISLCFIKKSYNSELTSPKVKYSVLKRKKKKKATFGMSQIYPISKERKNAYSH